MNKQHDQEVKHGGREITLTVFRYDPNNKDSVAGYRDYILEETPGMTLYIALIKILIMVEVLLTRKMSTMIVILGNLVMK